MVGGRFSKAGLLGAVVVAAGTMLASAPAGGAGAAPAPAGTVGAPVSACTAGAPASACTRGAGWLRPRVVATTTASGPVAHVAALSAPPHQATLTFLQLAPQPFELWVDGVDLGGYPADNPKTSWYAQTLFVPSGPGTIALYPSGQGPATASPLATASAAVAAGTDWTATAYADSTGALQVNLLPADAQPVAAGQAELVVRDLAATGPVDVYVDGVLRAPGMADDPAAPQTVVVDVPAGTATLSVTTAGNPQAVLFRTSMPVYSAEQADVDMAGAPASGSAPSSLAFDIVWYVAPTGYWEAGADGSVYAEGTAPFFGSMGGTHLAEPIVAMAHPAGAPGGYWLLGADGGLFAFGDAGYFGSLPADGVHVSDVVGMASSFDDGGYWEVGRDGGVFAFGDAGYFGSLPADGVHVSDVVGLVPTFSGRGYWMVSSDGGVFAFGDAAFLGSLGATHLDAPIVAMQPTPDGGGYWLFARDGGVFAYGDAQFLGSAGGLPLAAPIVAATASDDGQGYRLYAADGGVFDFGNDAYAGVPGKALSAPVLAADAP